MGRSDGVCLVGGPGERHFPIFGTISAGFRVSFRKVWPWLGSEDAVSEFGGDTGRRGTADRHGYAGWGIRQVEDSRVFEDEVFAFVRVVASGP